MREWLRVWAVLQTVAILPGKVSTQQQGRCQNVYTADIVFLVDGSSSIGRPNFQQIRMFMEGILNIFINAVKEDGVRFGVVQYSDDPRVEFSFLDHKNGTEVKKAIQSLSYKGGNTRTGTGLKYLADHFFGTSAIRANIPKVVILITDGKSQDSITNPSIKLKSQDVKVFAVGIKNADRQELEQVSSKPTEQFLFYVTNFKILQTLLPLVTRRVCESVGGVLQTDATETYTGPSNLVFVEETSESLRVRWTAAGGPVTGYRVQYVPLTELGQQITSQLREIDVRASDTITVLSELRAARDYQVTVIAQYANSIGESVTGKGRTRSSEIIPGLRIIDSGPFSLSLSWGAPAIPLQGYRITYTARGDSQGEKTLSAASTSATLNGLVPNTEYTITLYPIFPGSTAEASSIVTGKTLQLEGVQQLDIRNISSQSMQVFWRGVSGVTGYRVSWRPVSGRDTVKVDIAANRDSYLIQNLLPNTDYVVTVNALYGLTEGTPVTTRVKTGEVQTLRAFAVDTNSIKLIWNVIREARGYRLEWRRAEGDERPQTVSFPTSTNSYEITALDAGTEYFITLYTLYEGREVATPASTILTDGPVGIITNLKVLDVASNRIRLGWTGVPGATSYRIVIRNSEDDSEVTELIPGDRNTFDVENLKEGIVYNIRISALIDGREGSPVPITIRTAKTVTIDTVSDIRVLDVRGGRIQLTWTGVPGATQYKFVIRSTEDGTEFVRFVPGDQNTFEIHDLKEGITYIIRVSTLIGTREGNPITISVRTEEATETPVPGVTNLKVTDSGISYIRIAWDRVARATEYKITWHQADGREFSRTVAGDVFSYNIEGLQQNSAYTVGVTARVGSREGIPATIIARTEEAAVPGVTNLRVTESGINNIRIAWSRVARATGYKITWRHLGREFSRIVASDVFAYNIEGLQENSAYTVGVTARVGSREGIPATIIARTGLQVGTVTDLQEIESESRRVRISWAEVTRATGYKITWQHSDGVEDSRVVSRDITSLDLDGLRPDSVYVVRVSALVGDREGSPATITVRTAGVPDQVGTVTSLQILEYQSNVVRVRWVGVQGATAYRIIWSPTDGGPENSKVVSGEVTSVDIESLDPEVSYTVKVIALIGEREGNPVSISVKTPSSRSVSDFRVTDRRRNSVSLAWNAAPASTGYGLSWKLSSGGDPLQRISLSGASNTYVVSGLQLGKEYTFTVYPIYGDVPGADSFVSARTVCDRRRLHDIVFLVHATRDSASNEKLIKDFLYNVISSFADFGPDSTQVGLSMYSYRAQPWLLLGRSSNKETVLQMIRTIPYNEPSGNAIVLAAPFDILRMRKLWIIGYLGTQKASHGFSLKNLYDTGLAQDNCEILDTLHFALNAECNPDASG
ncbi:collagen alpha-1(VII) chain-like, partial [Protopterus annectens]|uniref:collagen alpha-1(VII) chain-like n=1 Tax=Protopterus annectens TaxID=7888 RepID=UPI001CFB970A